MRGQNIRAYPTEDYAQSANSLFHFMKKADYLFQILRQKALVPRYCIEDIEYLGIKRGDFFWKQVAVLQKCFCDIPLHRITQKFSLEGVGDEFYKLSPEDQRLEAENNSHPGLYGEFCIAFSKAWAEKNLLQPVHYLNDDSDYLHQYRDLFNRLLSQEEVVDTYSDDLLNRLTLIKPLRGTMERRIEVRAKEVEDKDNRTFNDGNIGNKTVTITLKKNFHDEQEWRFIPRSEALRALELDSVIAHPKVIADKELMERLNLSIGRTSHKSLWLSYRYPDIRYLIVPTMSDRDDLIHTIMNLKGEQFYIEGQNRDETFINEQKYILISKILVLNELRKDL